MSSGTGRAAAAYGLDFSRPFAITGFPNILCGHFEDRVVITQERPVVSIPGPEDEKGTGDADATRKAGLHENAETSAASPRNGNEPYMPEAARRRLEKKARDAELIENLSQPLYEAAGGSLRVAYGLAVSLRHTLYRRLTAADTAATHFTTLLLSALVEGLLAVFIIANARIGMRLIRDAGGPLIGVAYAQDRVVLPQSTVGGLAWLAAIVLAIVILGLFYSGFLAKHKSEKAQAILQHVLNAAVSIATGVVLSKGV